MQWVPSIQQSRIKDCSSFPRPNPAKHCVHTCFLECVCKRDHSSFSRHLTLSIGIYKPSSGVSKLRNNDYTIVASR